MTPEMIYLLVLLVAIVIPFVVLKRPIYEAMLIGYLVMIPILGKWNLTFTYLIKPSTNNLFYAIVAFLTLAYLFKVTDVVKHIINVILALVGRFRGGAGYVSLLGSTFMASLSGTGPGNVAATGVFTIPTMIRTKFPRALAATVEMSASSLGPMIPPSGTILLAFGVLEVLYPGTYSLSHFWMLLWIIGAYFILQRSLLLYLFCLYYKVDPMPEAEIPKLGQALKEGWKSLMLPVLIFVPLLIDFKFGGDLILPRLGKDGAKAFSSSIILFVPGITAIYAIWLSRKVIPGGPGIVNLFNLFKGGMKQVVPVAATVYFAYSIAYLLKDANVGTSLGETIKALEMSKLQMAIVIPLITTVLGMILPGSSQIAIFGGGIVAGMAALGVDPLLIAAMLPAITGALEGMTPPLALAMFAAVGIAESSISETSVLAYIWVFAHLIVAVLILMGVLPLFII